MRPDRTWLDRELSPSTAARDADGTLRRYRELGDAARALRRVHEHVPYGPRPEQRCHVFPAARTPAPALVFVHGGHWQASGLDEGCFAAERTLDGGAAFVAVGYGRAPERPLAAMVASVRRALQFLAADGGRFGIDPDRLHVAGSSAGAHLLAAALAGPGAPRVRSATLLSGLYDLTDIPHSYVNDAVGLTARTAAAASPVRMRPPACDRVVLAVGEHETSTYLLQQRRYAARLRCHGTPVHAAVVADRDHFDLPLDLPLEPPSHHGE